MQLIMQWYCSVTVCRLQIIEFSFLFAVKEIVLKLLFKFLGSSILGFLSSRVIIFWLQNVFNDGIIEVVLSFTMAYILFFIGKTDANAAHQMQYITLK